VVLVVNHVPLEIPRVEVLYYYPARKSLVYKKTISSEHFFAANKIAATDSEMVHANDDTPSFFLLNDHGYNVTDWKREYEEKYNLPASSMAYYNARADKAQEVGWRFQLPHALVAADDTDSVWISQAKAGTLDLYKNHMLSEEHQQEEIISVDTRQRLKVTWPGMMNEEILNTKAVNVGLDYDPVAQSLVTLSHTRYNNYLQIAKEKIVDKDGKPSVESGFVISKAVMYPVRVGETRPKPQKDVVIDPEEHPRRYRYQYFVEPRITHDGSDFGSPSAIAVLGGKDGAADRVLVSSHYESGFLDCSF